MTTEVYSVRLDTQVVKMLKEKAEQIRVPHQVVTRCLIEDAVRKPAVELIPVPRDIETEQE